ncbi:MAG: phage tail tape measure protein, partial [Tannerellaceae bacterium]|nr:phage tail tape measure protein [Tannerellaceae bacterium]
MGKKLSEDEIKWILSVDSAEAQQNIHKLNKANKELNNTNKAYKKTMQELVAQGKKESQEYKNLNKAVKENEATIAKNKKTMAALTDTMNTSQLTMAQLRKRASELKRQLDQTSQGTHPEQYAALNRQLKETRNRMEELNTSGQKIKSTFSAANLAKGGLIAGIALLAREIKNGVNVLKDFEAANSNLAAILGTTRKDIKELTEDAKRLGSTTSFTASQVTLLQTELAKLGFSRQEILESTPGILAFANAVGEDLPQAAKLAGSTLRMFGLETNEMDRVVSALGVSTTKSALNFSFLENAMSTVGPVAKSFGFTVEDTIALLGTLADSGFDASSAATATRNILLNLADSSGSLAKALGGPIASFDELIPAMALLKDHGVDLATTLELTDKRSVAAFNTFLNGTEKAQNLRDAITDCGDALKAMQEEKLDNLQGSITILSSAWEGLLLKFEESNGVMRSGIDMITQLIYVIGKLVDWTSKYGTQIKTLLVVIGTYITLQKTRNFLKRQYLIINGQAIATTRTEIVLLKSWNKLVAIKNTLIGVLTGKIKLAAAAQAVWNAVSAVNPYVLLASAVGGLISYLTIFRTKTKESAEAQLELADAVDEAREAMERMEKIRDKN